MKQINKYIILVFLFSLVGIIHAQQRIQIFNGKLDKSKEKSLIKTFAVSKGDIVELKLNPLHKKKGVSLRVVQHPGNLTVLDFDELTASTKYVVAQADAIYEVYCGGEKIEYELEINNYTNTPNGPGKGEIVYVIIPDTTFVSGFVNKHIGDNFKLVPYKEKVILGSYIQAEPIASRDFITGVDLMTLQIPGDTRDEFREQKLLSYNISLTVDAPSCYNAMMGVVDAGMDAFMPDLSPTSVLTKKAKKMNQKNRCEVVGDVQKENEKWEKTVETIKLAQELGDSLSPEKNGNFDKVINTTGFLLDADGMKKMALNAGLNAVGAPSGVQSMVEKIEEIPSATDFLKDGIHKYAGKIKGTAKLNIYEIMGQSHGFSGHPSVATTAPQTTPNNERLILSRIGGAINEIIPVAKRNEGLNLNIPYREVKLEIRENNYVSDAKLLVEAKYLVTDYTEVIKYRKIPQPVNTKEYLATYKIFYNYAIMFKDQVKDYYQLITPSAYYNEKRPECETKHSNDPDQDMRLAKFNLLVQNSVKR